MDFKIFSVVSRNVIWYIKGILLVVNYCGVIHGCRGILLGNRMLILYIILVKYFINCVWNIVHFFLNFLLSLLIGQIRFFYSFLFLSFSFFWSSSPGFIFWFSVPNSPYFFSYSLHPLLFGVFSFGWICVFSFFDFII